ncbi:Pantothenate kinase [Roseivivax jejudonensis]|uniref:Pantothenate kinase n=1 Tax=Roseivivax jejudonensis TaxID=1529041 RepID=A0A1X6ZEC4_9RHOB|nr:nucleoside/nucleotide kinase family protein [Roseivivax jejudonensis]SLN49322.1 Pantothenate kinase [Roseivivax jejudonensis]
MSAEPVTEAALADRLAALPRGRRHLVAIAGAPGSGKSTLAETLVAGLAAAGRPAAILPMDGFHLDDRVLEPRGLRPRKGAPETFDAAGLAHLLGRLKRNDEAEIAVPVFDREIEIARAGARMIPQAVEIVVVEGNYLLLERAPWDALAPLFDLSVRLDVPEPVLRDRLAERWRGFGLAAPAIRAKLEENDLPNGRLVLSASRMPDLVVAQG